MEVLYCWRWHRAGEQFGASPDIISACEFPALGAVIMPIHDWTRVDAGIFHDFHHEWISMVRRALNNGLLPPEYYALAEQQAAGFGPDPLGDYIQHCI
jgi:hypothetical protein